MIMFYTQFLSEIDSVVSKKHFNSEGNCPFSGNTTLDVHLCFICLSLFIKSGEI